MQPQDYLPFFQDLALQTYQTTLDLPVYAACLTVIVWLLTAIFYSIRISFIKSHLNRALKAGKEIQAALGEAEQREQLAQEEARQSQAEKEHSEQERSQLSERLDELAQQFTKSINALAANPDLGQPGLTAAPGLAPEALWQRFNAASHQISEKLLEQGRELQNMQLAVQDEVAKAAEKEQQLQAMQLRLESQSQQLAKLSLAQEEHKAELAAQQQASQQQLLELEARYRREMSALSASKNETKPEVKASVAVAPVAPLTATVTDPAPSSAPVVNPDVFKTETAPVTPASPSLGANLTVPVDTSAAFRAAPINPVSAEPAEVKVSVSPVTVTASAVVTPAAPASAPNPASADTKANKETKPVNSAGTNKLKGFFASAKDTFNKIDKKLGSPTEEVVASTEESVSIMVEPVVAASPVAQEVSPAPAYEPEPAPVATTPEPVAKKGMQLGGLFNKLKRK